VNTTRTQRREATNALSDDYNLLPQIISLERKHGYHRQTSCTRRTTNTNARCPQVQALAWIGTEAVQAQFSAFRLHPPAWRAELFVLPENYSQEAGWELTENGGRRDLYFSTCFELIPIEQAIPFQRRTAEPTTSQECCAWCQRPLQRVLDLDLRDPRCRWITAEGERLCLAVCTRCSFYATTYLDITDAIPDSGPLSKANWRSVPGRPSRSPSSRATPRWPLLPTALPRRAANSPFVWLE
jgi:hypothetical protein